jgi:hypothetical protein
MIEEECCKTESKWEKQEKALKAEVQKIAKGSKSTILKDMAAEKKMQDDEQCQMRCRLISMVTDEARESYRGGEMTFEEMRKDLIAALNAIE